MDVLTALGRIFAEEIARTTKRLAGVAGAQTGAVSFPQRFGGSLNLHVHFHHLPVNVVFEKLRRQQPGKIKIYGDKIRAGLYDAHMRIYVGNAQIGRTDVFDYECIKTEFFILGLPLFPVASFYLTPYERRAALADPDSDNKAADAVLPLWAATRIQSHSKSVRAAYVRWWGVFVVAFSPAFAKGIWGAVLLLVTGLAWLALYVASTSTPRRQKKERFAFSRATGVAAWPEILYPDTARRVFDKLESDWKARHKKSAQRVWRAVAPGDLGAEDLCALYALCRYARVVDGSMSRETIEAVRERLDAVDLGDTEAPAAKISKPLLAFVLLLVGGPIALLVLLTPATPAPGVEASAAPSRAATSKPTSTRPKEPTRVAPSAMASAASVSDSPLVYHSLDHGFSLNLPSEHWTRRQPSDPVVQFSTQIPLPMAASIISIEKQSFQQYGNALFAFEEAILSQKGLLGKPNVQEVMMDSDSPYQLTTYRKEGSGPGQSVYAAASRNWLRAKQITVTVLVEGQGTDQSTRQGFSVDLEVKRAAESIGLSIKATDLRHTP